MDFALLGLLLGLFSAWLWSEFQTDNRPLRVSLGAILILILGGGLYSSQLRNLHLHAHDSASIRAIGAALKDGQIEATIKAIDDWENTQGATGSFILERLPTHPRN